SINEMLDIGSARITARQANVPTEVLSILMLNMAVVAFILGYALTGRKGRMASHLLLALFTIAVMLIIDLDRPTSGGIREPQGAMIAQLKAMEAGRAPVPGNAAQ
ncbi:MAG: hypothetical protein ACK5NN_02470, partial [Sphingomonadaceae bacterium]